MEKKDSKDTLPVHLILGASDYARIKTETAPRVAAIGEPIGDIYNACLYISSWDPVIMRESRPKLHAVLEL